MLSDLEYINRALDLAEQGRGQTSPNPMVGALVVGPSGAILGQGYHARAGEAHAEVRALDQAGDRARGATLFVTLEPCSHTGRTGPCADRVAAAGVSRVVASSRDPNPLVAGKGFDLLRERGIEVVVGPGRERALRLNRPFVTWITEGRPLVIMKAATTLDNCVASGAGGRLLISSADSLRHAQGVRAEVDAIAVGSGTLLADDPLLTVRDRVRARPLSRVVFDRRLRTPPSSRLFSTLDAGPVIIVTTPEGLVHDEARTRELERAGAQLEPIDGGDLRAAFRRLGQQPLLSVIVEGGPSLHRALIAQGLVDAVHLYVAPTSLGADGVRWVEPEELRVASLADRRVIPCGPDVFMEGYVHRID